MSHFSVLKVNLTNSDAVIAALQFMGFSVDVYPTPQDLQTTYRGGPLQPKAHIIVRANQLITAHGGSVGADLGFRLEGDGTIQMVGDSYALAMVKTDKVKYGTFVSTFEQAYGREVALSWARSMGYSWTEVEEEDGSTSILCEV